MKRREIIEFEVGKMEFGGTSSTVIGKRNVNMKGGITGQKVKASVKKANSQKAEVKLLEVLEKSPLETEQACKHFGQCGGCTILSLPYEKQLELKKQQILDLFESHDITGFEFLGIESSPNNTCYRNKMEFTFGNEMKDGPLTIGMHKKGRHIDILTVDGCMLIDQDFIKILTATEEFFRAEGLPYYRGNDHKGYLRHLVVRKGIKTNEMMVMIVTSTQLDYDMDKYKDMLLGLDLEADLASVLHCLNDNLADAVKCDELRVLHGRDHIYEELLGLRFKISPFSFFQTNSKGAESLYSLVRDFMGDGENKVVFDLYCGTGTIGQIAAPNAKKVVGLELIEEAVEAARENAKLNGLNNCTFIAGDVAETIKKVKDKPDIIILDPPRSGVSPKALDYVIRFNAPEIIYVSCNPKTMVENLDVLLAHGYTVDKSTVKDMFPNTPHAETVVRLTKSGAMK